MFHFCVGLRKNSLYKWCITQVNPSVYLWTVFLGKSPWYDWMPHVHDRNQNCADVFIKSDRSKASNQLQSCILKFSCYRTEEWSNSLWSAGKTSSIVIKPARKAHTLHKLYPHWTHIEVSKPCSIHIPACTIS